MIIDDSIITRKILEVCLSRAGFPCVSFPKAAQALVALKQQPGFIPAVVILDVCLPGMTGFTVARLLRSNKVFDKTAIIMLTGYDSLWNRLQARLLKTRYMLKPFRTQEILSAVSTYTTPVGRTHSGG